MDEPDECEQEQNKQTKQYLYLANLEAYWSRNGGGGFLEAPSCVVTIDTGNQEPGEPGIKEKIRSAG